MSEEIRREVAAAVAAERAALNGDEPAPAIDPDFVHACLWDNEAGDGRLFAHLMRDKFVFLKARGQWLRYTGHHWEVDKMDLSRHAVTQNVCDAYASQAAWYREAAAMADESDEEKRLGKAAEAYCKRIQRLKSGRGAKNCLEWAHCVGEQSIAIVGDEIDKKPLLLPVANGVLDLRLGSLSEGNPADYLVRAVPHEWQGIEAPAPAWEAFIEEIHGGDQELVNFVRRLLGYAITGLTVEHFVACFIGEGRNGKGTMFEVLGHVLGELYWAINPELILEQKFSRSSAGPSADLISLQGRRFVVASETDDNRRISAASVKKLTGADTICARAPHDTFEINFEPSHKLFLATNHPPKGLTADYALFKRLLYINYPLKFIDDPKMPDERKRDPALPAKLRSEASGILAWLVSGCLEWQQMGGLHPPASVRANAEELALSEDYFQQFFNESCEIYEFSSILFGDVYEKFKEWYREDISENEKYITSRKRVSQWLTGHGFRVEKKGGKAVVHGLAFKIG